MYLGKYFQYLIAYVNPENILGIHADGKFDGSRQSALFVNVHSNCNLSLVIMEIQEI
jgi:hypothetical protein